MMMRRVGLVVILVGLLLAGSTAKGTSIIFPKFSTPILADDRLIFASPDAKRLLCVGLDGKMRWEQRFDSPVRLFTGALSEPLLQTGRVVSCVLADSGALRAKFAVEDKNDGISYSAKLGTFISRDLRFKKRMFKVLDTKSGKPLWRSAEVEDVICATPELFVCLTAERIPRGKGYTFGKASLDAYTRTNFVKKWSVPLSAESGVPFVCAALKAPYLVYTETKTALTVLDCTTGRKRSTKRVDVPEYGWISDMKVEGGQLVWLTHKMNHSDFNNSEHMLHFCTIPELDEVNVVTLKVIEIARIAFEGGFIISDALYRTACFKPSGEKVWERFQTERTPVINDRIYFSDYDRQTARLGWVEVPTGNETILYSEKVEEAKR